MASYLERFDATAESGRWPLVRGWIYNEPLPFFAEIRANRPILITPEVTLAFGAGDCTEILRHHQVFSVALYKAKQGDYWMAQDDTAVHWREKSIMRAILDFEDIPAIRSFIADQTASRLTAAGGTIDAVAGLTRAVPLALVKEWFGFAHGDTTAMEKWSYWNQTDAFWNQPFDAFYWPDPAAVVRHREIASVELAAYLVALVAAREAEVALGVKPHDSVSRLVELSRSKALNFDVKRVIQNVGGLLIGAVETTSHAVVNALEYLMAQPEVLVRARAAALGGDPTAADGFAFEALRFKPAFPYFFRMCEQDTVLGRGEPHEARIAKGTTVLAVTHSAMFDPHAISQPETFDPTRGLGNQYHFGFGLHECLGRAIAVVMIPEIVRQCLRLGGLTAGTVDYNGGPVPEAWQWRWG